MAGSLDCSLYLQSTDGRQAYSANINLGPIMCSALLGLHCFTGCDSVGAFKRKGEKKTFQLLKANDKFLTSFSNLGKNWTVPDNVMAGLEEFTCLMYGQKAEASINRVRYNLFKLGTVADCSLPPCQDCLHQHIERSNYRAAIHQRCLQPYMQLHLLRATGG